MSHWESQDLMFFFKCFKSSKGKSDQCWLVWLEVFFHVVRILKLLNHLALCITPAEAFLHQQVQKLLQMIGTTINGHNYQFPYYTFLSSVPTSQLNLHQLITWARLAANQYAALVACVEKKKHYHNPHESFHQAWRLIYCENSRAASGSSCMHNLAILIWGFAHFLGRTVLVPADPGRI